MSKRRVSSVTKRKKAPLLLALLAGFLKISETPKLSFQRSLPIGRELESRCILPPSSLYFFFILIVTHMRQHDNDNKYLYPA